MDKVTGDPKGDATGTRFCNPVTYDDPQTSDAAVDWFNGKEFMGNVIHVEKATQKAWAPPSRGGRGGYSDRGLSRGGYGNGPPRNEGDWLCSAYV